MTNYFSSALSVTLCFNFRFTPFAVILTHRLRAPSSSRSVTQSSHAQKTSPLARRLQYAG
jgi:hypothetical protein